MTQDLQADDYCFACGPANPHGLKLHFTFDREGRASAAAFTPGREHQGFAGLTHGGILAACLDEAMLQLAWTLGIPAVTARFEMELKKAAPTGGPLRVRGWIDEDRGRVVTARAEITDAAGELVARAKATAVVRGRRLEPAPL